MSHTDLAVANTIREQLGPKTLMMLGAQNFLGSKDALQFRIRGSKKVNSIRIVLDPSDTYTVEFHKVGRAPRFECKLVATVDDVHVDSLHGVIETHTGLATRL